MARRADVTNCRCRGRDPEKDLAQCGSVGPACGESTRMIADVLHFSFTVSDIDESISWYTDVLGLELVHRQRQENDYTPLLVGIPGAVLEVAQFKIPGLNSPYSTHMLELVQYITP